MAKRKKNELEHYIDVEMLDDRYRLTVDLNIYFYPDAVSLMEGIIVHVGMEREECISLEHFQHLMAAFKKGTAEKWLQGEVKQLNNVIKEKDWEIKELKERNNDLWSLIRKGYENK